MLTVSAPPRPPRVEDPEALFEEARRHRRHRWLKAAAATLAVIAAGAAVYVVVGRGTNHLSTFQVLKHGVLTSVPMQTVVLLVDVSGSMRATDVQPTRLDATVAAMQTFLDQLPTRIEVAVVTFSDTAKVVQAPTRDRQVVRNALDSLSPESGTGLGNGLAAAVELTVASLAREGIHRAPSQYLPAAIVLESDGAQNIPVVATPLQAAHQAKEAGIRVDGIALGTRDGVVKFGAVSQISVPVPPDPKTVAQIAHVTGGASFTAPTAARLEAIHSSLASSIAR